MTVDPITLEVVRNGCAAVAEEMNATLVRTAYSPNVMERRDCSCALFDAEGEMINQAETLPVHLGAMPFSVAAALERFPPEKLAPGDGIMLNDPFAGGAHLPDLTLVTPVFDADGELLGICANRAHHADVGGATAGSVGATATEIYQEGIRLPPVKLVANDTLDPDLLGVVLANVRTPDERRGDLRAQQAANATGRRRFRELTDRVGVDTARAAFDAIMDYSERRMRSAIADFPDGTYTFTDHIDDDGRGNEDLPIAVAVEIIDDRVIVDFEGSAPQTGGPLNAVFAVTASATYYAIRCLTDPDIPPNAGCYRPIEIETPSASIVDAKPPAAVVGGNLEVSQRITDAILGAIGDVLPERSIAACQGTMNNLTFGGTDPRTDRPYAFYETEAGGFGGRATGDGLDGVHVHMTNTMNTPVEILETAYPLRVEQYGFRPDSGGPGRHRGGLGIRRDLTIRDHDATVSLLGERRRTPPYGIAGGESGSTGEDYLISDGNLEAVSPKSTHVLSAGTTVSIRTPGGGGYGDPLERELAAIRQDLELEKVSIEHARRAYGYDVD